MEFTSKQNKERVLIGIEGRILSMLDAEPLLGEVESQLQGGHTLFILDLSKTEYLNSEGLNVLLKILTKTRNAGGETVLCRISEELEKLFIITKLAPYLYHTGYGKGVRRISEKQVREGDCISNCGDTECHGEDTEVHREPF